MRNIREWLYIATDGKQYGPMPERQLVQILQGYSLDPDEVAYYSFRCLGSSKWIDFNTFLQFVEQVEGARGFPPDFFDNPEETPEPIFFPVSQRKFLIMSACTFWMYYFYWVFKMWSYIKKVDIRSSKRYTPFLFAVLDPVFPVGLIILRGFLSKYTDREAVFTTYGTAWIMMARSALILLGLLAASPPPSYFSNFAALISIDISTSCKQC